MDKFKKIIIAILPILLGIIGMGLIIRSFHVEQDKQFFLLTLGFVILIFSVWVNNDNNNTNGFLQY